LGVVVAVFLLILFEESFVKFSAGLGTAFYPSGTIPIDATVTVKVLLISFLGAQQQGDTIMAARDNDGDFCGQPHDAVAAKAIAEQGSVVPAALNIAGAVERLPGLSAEFVRFIVQALRHQNHIDNVL
jgi:hypothetical protein